MPYSYCSACNEPMDAPTPSEAMRDDHRCACGKRNSVNEYAYQEAYDSLFERLARLEAVVALIVPRPPT